MNHDSVTATGAGWQPPENYAQWRSLLTREATGGLSATCDILVQGKVDATSAWPVMELVSRYCEAQLNHETKRLRMHLESYGGDSQTVALSCTRYSKACHALMFFEHVAGFPHEAVESLRQQIRAFVIHVLETVEQESALSGDDIAYQIRRLKRGWM